MIAIIGAGVTGLRLGWELKKKGIPFRLFEASDRVGGNLWSDRQGPYLFEKGPNSLMMNDNIHQLLAELDLIDRILRPSAQAKFRFILRDGKYKKLPSGPVSFLFSGTFGFKEKLRALKERRIAPGGEPGESVDAFFRRRFGDAVADYAVAPFISGIYAGDSSRLEMDAAFPRIREMETHYGAVLKGIGKGPRQTHKGMFSLKGGLQVLTETLGEKLKKEISVSLPLKTLEEQEDSYLLHFEAEGMAPFQADKVVFCIPPKALAGLLASVAPPLSDRLKEIPLPPVTLVHTIWSEDQVRHPLNGFGALHNFREDSFSLGSIFSSSVFPGRCPEGEVMLTTFVGGAKKPQNALKPNDGILEGVIGDFKRFLGVNGEPLKTEITPYPHAIPQYEPGIRDTWKIADSLSEKGLFFGGNWIGGISVPNCLDRAVDICEKVAD